jgi:long-chain acyl-CoA synthetase
MKDFTRLFDILQVQQSSFPQQDAFSSKVNGTWVKRSTAEIISEANRVSLALLKLGVQPMTKLL